MIPKEGERTRLVTMCACIKKGVWSVGGGGMVGVLCDVGDL